MKTIPPITTEIEKKFSNNRRSRHRKKKKNKKKPQPKCADTPGSENNGIINLHPCQTKKRRKCNRRNEKKPHKKQKKKKIPYIGRRGATVEMYRYDDKMMCRLRKQAKLVVSKPVAGSSSPDSLLLVHHSPPRPSPAAQVFL